ncbi:MAG: murein transglycosylase [Alphaproteobacteria bacterium]|nr:murein transglycosylase [Alphaproteobacteria bacterium]
MRFFALALSFFLASCAGGLPPEDAPLNLRPASFSADLPGWGNDRHSEALAAFRGSCERILKQDPQRTFGPIGGTYGDWQGPCRAAMNLPAGNDAAAKVFFEAHFLPYQTLAGRHKRGLFTGYYEPSLSGSLTRFGPYQTPLRAKPSDLVMVDLGEFRDELKGQRIAGRVQDGRLKPFEDRAEIAAGKLPNETELPLVWVDDPVDAFFLQIQGSGRVLLPDGQTLRLGYAGQNGHPYYAIGRELIKRGELTKENVSLQTIRAWLEANPDQAANLMNLNKSYVFFQVLEGEGPLGGEGLPLTPERSLAVDRSKIAYGIPVFVDIDPPVKGESGLRRLMVAQDTGGAIRGAIRGDVFWGYGERAEHMAGHMKSKGRAWLLLPKGVTDPSRG